MPKITDPGTGFLVGDPDIVPLSADSLPSAAEVGTAASRLILSASGWRKVFAADGDEESDSGAVSGADIVLAGAAAIAFAGLLRSRSRLASPALLVGIDSRPTGPAIADAMIRVFLALGLSPRYLFIVAAPEIMAYARAAPAGGLKRREPGAEARPEGFCYVSASHNPRGHNGIKFGLSDGGVLGAADSGALIEAYRALLADGRLAARVMALMEAVEARDVARVYSGCLGWKRRSISAYTLFAHEVISGTEDLRRQEELFDRMAEAAEQRPVGVVAELNGSARCVSIDRDFLAGLGVRVRAVNDRPRDFAHRIVPEGQSLADAMRELEAAAAKDPAFVAAYVPDCDGDRGNLVVLGRGGSARPAEAQEVFALCCAAELSQLVRDGRLSYDESGNAREKAALVVNDATSMRINAIARAFDVDVFRAETGEANVVGLANSLREKGYIVRILGEGSNGGNITYPSAVRDPLSTLGALLKFLLLRGKADARGREGPSDSGGDGLFDIWLRRSSAVKAGRGRAYDANFGIDDILESLPAFATTSVFEARAALRVRSADQAALKARYAAIFAREWEERRKELASRFGVASWEAFASRGQEETRVGADFAASGSGGLRIAFADQAGVPRAFLWMRGSGTEPVFRVMADVEGGGAADEEYFLAWHAAMVREADRS
jgi:phosphoglucomutase